LLFESKMHYESKLLYESKTHYAFNCCWALAYARLLFLVLGTGSLVEGLKWHDCESLPRYFQSGASTDSSFLPIHTDALKYQMCASSFWQVFRMPFKGLSALIRLSKDWYRIEKSTPDPSLRLVTGPFSWRPYLHRIFVVAVVWVKRCGNGFLASLVISTFHDG
jgi:hypothetical protein